jgi:hypothetical protein
MENNLFSFERIFDLESISELTQFGFLPTLWVDGLNLFDFGENGSFISALSL